MISRRIDLHQAAELLKQQDNILILCHNYPDGDTLGSACALYRGLLCLGKKAKITCNMPLPSKFEFLFEGLPQEDFAHDFIVAVDIASLNLLGSSLQQYAKKIDLCIDHHKSNTGYAKELLLDFSAAATTEIVTQLLGKMGVEITPIIADCLYTGICTDTGCFNHSNVTAETHKCAAYLIERGAKAAYINEVMFGTKSKARIAVERILMQNMEYHFDGRCALTHISEQEIEVSGAKQSDLDGLSAIPLQIEGVKVSVYIRQTGKAKHKLSIRTRSGYDASKICSILGGGGHEAAAGCEIEAPLQETIDQILRVVEEQIK